MTVQAVAVPNLQHEYQLFRRRVIRTYLFGAALACGWGSVSFLIYFSFSRQGMTELMIIVPVAFIPMALMDIYVAHRHLRPIHNLVENTEPHLVDIEKAYETLRRWPFLSVIRVMGPHFCTWWFFLNLLTFLSHRYLGTEISVTHLLRFTPFGIVTASLHAIFEFQSASQYSGSLMKTIRRTWGKSLPMLQPGKQISVSVKLITIICVLGILPIGALITTTYLNRLFGMDMIGTRLLWTLTIWVYLSGNTFILISGWLLSKGIVQPVEVVQEGMTSLARGFSNIRVNVDSWDELGSLVQGFNHMSEQLALQKRTIIQKTEDAVRLSTINEIMEKAFGQYVSPQIMGRILQQGSVELKGEEREVTVMFFDIRDFTARADKLPPEILIWGLNRLFENLVDAIDSCGGYVNKFIGDSIFAIFGAPGRMENHAEQAVRAADVMRTRIHNLRRHDNLLLQDLRFGIGIHTGLAVLGNIGSEKRLEYTAIGSTVNTASRVEGMNKQLSTEILISESTYRIVKEIAIVKPYSGQWVRGLPGEHTLYSLEAIIS